LSFTFTWLSELFDLFKLLAFSVVSFYYESSLIASNCESLTKVDLKIPESLVESLILGLCYFFTLIDFCEGLSFYSSVVGMGFRVQGESFLGISSV
jgi:hypothetical protein